MQSSTRHFFFALGFVVLVIWENHFVILLWTLSSAINYNEVFSIFSFFFTSRICWIWNVRCLPSHLIINVLLNSKFNIFFKIYITIKINVSCVISIVEDILLYSSWKIPSSTPEGDYTPVTSRRYLLPLYWEVWCEDKSENEGTDEDNIYMWVQYIYLIHLINLLTEVSVRQQVLLEQLS